MPLSEALTPVVINTTMTSADTEYEIALPAGTRHFELWCHDGTAMRFAFVTGKVATPTTPWATILANKSYRSPEKLAVGASTIYVAAGVISKVACCVVWVHK